MVRRCVGCGVRDKEGKILFRFPKNDEIRKKWMDALGLDKENLQTNFVVCEDHFSPDHWEKVRVDGKTQLKSSAVPALPPRDKKPNRELQDKTNKPSNVGQPGAVEHSYASKGQRKSQSQVSNAGRGRLKELEGFPNFTADIVASHSANSQSKLPANVSRPRTFEHAYAAKGQSKSQRSNHAGRGRLEVLQDSHNPIRGTEVCLVDPECATFASFEKEFSDFIFAGSASEQQQSCISGMLQVNSKQRHQQEDRNNTPSVCVVAAVQHSNASPCESELSSQLVSFTSIAES